jgi:hypothetical protein
MTSNAAGPLTATELVDEYFIETRNRVLEVAAFLDRIDRAGGAHDDFRMRALEDALQALSAASATRVAHIQMLLSDPTTEPRPALDRKGAVGAYGCSR